MTEFSQNFKLNKHWSNYIKNTSKFKYNWAEGAYRSSKSVSNTLAFALYLENTEDMLHLVIASTSSSAKITVEDGNGFGLKYYFGSRYISNKKYKGADCGYIDTKTGRKIIVYLGGNNKSSYQAFRGWSVGSIVLEELNLLHENTINEAKGRILMAKNPKIFISHNPVGPKHPMYKWLDELTEKNLVNYDHSTIYDNPALTDERREEIIKEFDPESIFFKQYILGERCDAEGAIYTIRDYNILEDYEPEDYTEYIIVCDQGESISASSFILAGLKYDFKDREYRVDILKNYYYINNGKNNASVKMFSDTAHDLYMFMKECIALMGKHPHQVLIDQDIEFYRNVEKEFRSNGYNTSIIKYVTKDEIESRIKSGINLLYKGKLRFYKGCEEVIKDFKEAVYDNDKIEKSGKFDRLKAYTTTGHLDSIDSVEYAFTFYKKYLYF